MLQAESNKLSMTMQRQLFKRLRANLQLPECLRIVGYLRRMGGFTENGLREEYLNCRDLWFQNLVNDLSKIDQYVSLFAFARATEFVFEQRLVFVSKFCRIILSNTLSLFVFVFLSLPQL